MQIYIVFDIAKASLLTYTSKFTNLQIAINKIEKIRLEEERLSTYKIRESK